MTDVAGDLYKKITAGRASRLYRGCLASVRLIVNLCFLPLSGLAIYYGEVTGNLGLAAAGVSHIGFVILHIWGLLIHIENAHVNLWLNSEDTEIRKVIHRKFFRGFVLIWLSPAVFCIALLAVF